jgi:hypothetical protein
LNTVLSIETVSTGATSIQPLLFLSRTAVHLLIMLLLDDFVLPADFADAGVLSIL